MPITRRGVCCMPGRKTPPRHDACAASAHCALAFQQLPLAAIAGLGRGDRDPFGRRPCRISQPLYFMILVIFSSTWATLPNNQLDRPRLGATELICRRERHAKECIVNWKIFVCLLAIGTCAIAVAQTTMGPVIVTAPPPPPTLPPVIATAPRVGGGTVICRGMGCAGVVEALQQEKMDYFMQMQMPILDPEEIEIDQAKVCASLKARRPSNCNLSSPPPSPGINISGQPTWQPNGCGTGGIGSWFQDFILERVAGQSYSGNLDSPYVGVSFKGACDSHDQCWAMGGNRTTCDINFRNSMNSACSQLSDSGAQGNCSGFASLYHGAVSTTDGSHGAYATSTANRACAVWANDMRENGCAN